MRGARRDVRGGRRRFDRGHFEGRGPETAHAKYNLDALAERFIERCGGDLLYVHDFARWHVRDGARSWRHDDTGAVPFRIRQFLRRMAAECTSPHIADALDSAETVAAVERLARFAFER
jgi:hypothetical protein